MKATWAIWMGGVIVVLISTGALASEEDMLAVVEAYEKAANTGDIRVFEGILALDDPQFTEFESHVPDLIGKKGVYDILNWRKEHPEFKYSVAYTNRKAFALSETLGYVTAYYRSKSDHGNGAGRVTLVLKRVGDQWKIIHGHWSKAPTPDENE